MNQTDNAETIHNLLFSSHIRIQQSYTQLDVKNRNINYVVDHIESDDGSKMEGFLFPEYNLAKTVVEDDLSETSDFEPYSDNDYTPEMETDQPNPIAPGLFPSIDSSSILPTSPFLACDPQIRF